MLINAKNPPMPMATTSQKGRDMIIGSGGTVGGFVYTIVGWDDGALDGCDVGINSCRKATDMTVPFVFSVTEANATFPIRFEESI